MRNGGSTSWRPLESGQSIEWRVRVQNRQFMVFLVEWRLFGSIAIKTENV